MIVLGTPTYTLIQEQVLGSASATVTFSSIPQTYKDLVLEVIAIADNTTSRHTIYRYNGDSGSNYSQTNLYANGSTTTSDRNPNITVTYPDLLGYTSTTGPQMVQSHFVSYSNTNMYKTIITRANSAGAEVTANVSLWRSTAAINAILVWLSGQNFATGSTFRLWGVLG